MRRLFWRLSTGFSRPALLGVVSIGFSFVLTSQPLDAHEIDQISRDVSGFNEQIIRLEERFLNPALLESRYRLETRFNDAKVAYMLNDFDRASVLFVDLLENPRVRHLDSYREIIYLLGDSLFKERNYRAAREYFRQLVSQGPGGFYQESLIRLLEIASTTKDYDGVDVLYKQLNSLHDISPSLSYMRAKTLFNQGSYDEAQQWFQNAAQDAEYAYVARYYEGVTLVANKRLDEATQVFEAITSMTPSAPEHRQIVELSLLALGRLAYESGDYDAASAYYVRIPRTSRYFERSLYELTWSLILKGHYQAARFNVELLLLSKSDPTFVPEAKLLLADLAMRDGDMEQAQQAFRDVIDTFSPAREELYNFIKHHEDLEAYFVELIYLGIEGHEPRHLPGMVAQWAEKDRLLDSATQIMSDVIVTQDDINDAREIIREIEVRINSGARVESFPQLAEGLALGIELENQLIEVRQRLLDKESELLAPWMSEQERELWQGYAQQMAKIQLKLASMPKTFDAIQNRRSRVSSEFGRLRHALDALGHAIENQRVEFAAINSYLRENPPDNLSADDRQKLDKMREDARQQINLLEQERVELRREIDSASRQMGIGDEVTASERDIRHEYVSFLETQTGFLQSIHSRAGAAARGELQKVLDIRTRIPAVDGRLTEFFRSMNAIVDERVQEVQQVLSRELITLAEYQEQLDQVTTSSESTAAGIAYLNFLRVGNQFDEIVQRGEVGLIDVSWRRKDGVSSQIQQIFKDRASEVQVLQDSFKDVR